LTCIYGYAILLGVEDTRNDEKGKVMKVALINIVTLDGNPIIKSKTAKAVCVEIEDGRTEWFPISQINGIIRTMNGSFIVTKLWLAKEKGLMYRTQVVHTDDLATAVYTDSAEYIEY